MSQPLSRLALTLLIGVIGSRLLIGLLSGAPLLPTLVWPALLAALSFSALSGKKLAAKALGYVLLALGAFSFLAPALVGRFGSILELVVASLWGTAAIGTGVYLLKSRTIKAFYARNTGEA